MDAILQWAIQAKQSEAERRKKIPKAKLGPFLTAIKNRRSGKTNSNIACTGEPGIGKSTFSLVCAEDLMPEVFVDHPETAIEKFVTFTGSAFGRAIRDSPEGSIIIGDEFGQQMHHRKFMHDENVSLSNVLQGFRFKEYISFLNLPALRYLDADAQGLLTWSVSVVRRGHAQIYRVTHPLFNGVDFYHTFIDDMEFGQPRPALWKAYVAAKVTNQEKVFDDSIRLMERNETVPMTVDEMVKKVLETPEKYTNEKGNFHVPSISLGLKIGRDLAYKVKAGADRQKQIDTQTQTETHA